MLHVSICCFFVIISVEVNPKRRASIFATDETYILLVEIIINSLTILLHEFLQNIGVVAWIPNLIYLFGLLFCSILCIRYFPFYNRWTNAVYGAALAARILLSFTSLIVFTIQSNSVSTSDVAFSISLVVLVLVFVVGFMAGFGLMISFEYLVIQTVKNEVSALNQQEKSELSSIATEDPAQQGIQTITVTKMSKLPPVLQQVQRFLVTSSWAEMAVKIQLNEPAEYLEQLFHYCEVKKFITARVQLYKAVHAHFVSNNTRIAFELLRSAMYDMNSNLLLKMTLWFHYHEINLADDSTQNEKVDKMIIAVRKLEAQLRQELKHLFELYIQKAPISKIDQTNENIQACSSDIRNIYRNMIRNYKLSKVYRCYAKYVEEFEKNEMKSMTLLERASQLQEEEEQELKKSKIGKLPKNPYQILTKSRVGKPTRITPAGFDSTSFAKPVHTSRANLEMMESTAEMQTPGNAVQAVETLANEIDVLEGQISDDDDEESKEETYRQMIRADRFKFFMYLFIIAIVVIPILMILVVAILSGSLSSAMYTFSDLGIVSRIPSLTLSYLRQVRMHLMSTKNNIRSITTANNDYTSMLQALGNVDSVWNTVPRTVAYPIMSSNFDQTYFKYENVSLQDLSRFMQQNMKQLTTDLSKLTKTQTLNSESFLFVWSNIYQLRLASDYFFKTYFQSAQVNIEQYMQSFYSTIGIMYFIRLTVFLSTTFGISMYVFGEKNRVLELYRDIPSEVFAAAYRELDENSKSTNRKNANVTVKGYKVSGLAVVPTRLVLVIIYSAYLLLEFAFIIATFGVFGNQAVEFQKDTRLIYHISVFRNYMHQINFAVNEYYFDTRVNNMLKTSLIREGNVSYPISYIAKDLGSNQLLATWNLIASGTASSTSMKSLVSVSGYVKAIWDSVPCFTTNANGTQVSTPVPYPSLELYWNETCGVSINEIVLKYIKESAQTIEILSSNTTAAVSAVPFDILYNQYIICSAITRMMIYVILDIATVHDMSQEYAVFVSIYATVSIIAILVLAVPFIFVWTRVLRQGYLVRQILLFLNMESLEAAPSIRDYILHYTVHAVSKSIRKRMKQEKAASVIQAAVDSVLILNSKCKIQDVNKSCLTLSGYSSAELLGQQCSLLFGKGIESLVEELYFDRKPFTEEIEMQKLDGSKVPMRACGSLGNWNEEQMVCIFARDISLERKQNELLNMEKQHSENLLLNILPAHVAQRLKNGESQIAEKFDDVTILFSDMCNFTVMSSKYTPMELIGMLNDVVTAFDDLSLKHGLEKIKTIGDAYMVVGGLTAISSADHPKRMCFMALDMLKFMISYNEKRGTSNDPERCIKIRVGINTGAISAGIVGKLKFVYDVFGDAINVASRMESSGVPMRVHVSRETYERVFDLFAFEERTIDIKGKGILKTYLMK